MGEAQVPAPAKLITGLFSAQVPQFTLIKKILEKNFGEVDSETDVLDFSCTAYYEKEFGKNLKRKFFSFKRLIPLRKNYEIKLCTNKIERRLSGNNKRTINIDPGYVSLTKLVLFTTKNRSHRIYLDRGIYAERELEYVGGTFRPLDWTYPDYRTAGYIEFFNSVREAYKRETTKCGLSG